MFPNQLSMDTLQTLSPEMIMDYLKRHQWQFERDWFEKAQIWTYQHHEQALKVFVPLKKTYADYSHRLYEILTTLSQLEQRPTNDIIYEIRHRATLAGTLQIHALYTKATHYPENTLPLSRVLLLYQGAYQLCSALIEGEENENAIHVGQSDIQMQHHRITVYLPALPDLMARLGILLSYFKAPRATQSFVEARGFPDLCHAIVTLHSAVDTDGQVELIATPIEGDRFTLEINAQIAAYAKDLAKVVPLRDIIQSLILMDKDKNR